MLQSMLSDQPLVTIALTDAVGENDETLKTVTICPWGEVESTKGSFVFDEESAAEIVKAFSAHGAAIPIDVEHETLGPSFQTPAGHTGAVGWIESFCEEPGKRFVGGVRWNERGRELIRGDAFRYLSPVFEIRVSDRKVVGIHSAAITTKPAMPKMEKLAASQTIPGETVAFRVPDELKRLKAAMGISLDTMDHEAVRYAVERVGQNAADQHLARTVRDHFKLPPSASVDAVLAAMANVGHDVSCGKRSPFQETFQKICKAIGVPMDADEGTVLTALSGLKSKASPTSVTVADAVYDETLRESATSKQQRLEREALKAQAVQERAKRGEILYASAIAGNRISPHHKASAEAFHQIAIEDPDRFELLVMSITPYAPTGVSQPPPKEVYEREKIIRRALSQYEADPKLQAITSRESFVNGALRDDGFERVGESDRKMFRLGA